METKTPQFDAALDEILNDLVPQTRTCRWSGRHHHCEQDFAITNEDIDFLKMLRVPPPNFCPTCRRIRRFVHLTSLQLFRRPCEAPGHNEQMISIFPPECPFPVYDYECFTGDEFDSTRFARTYIEGSPMAQLLNMRQQFPMPSFLNRDPSSINSEYSNGGRNLKNGYYVTACFDVEDAWYSQMIRKSQLVMDSVRVQFSESIYECLSSDNLYNTMFVYFSSHCTDCVLLFDCRNCSDCFGCVNLRNAKYCVFNQLLTKEAYSQFIATLHPFSRGTLKKNKEKFWALVKSLPMNAPRILNSHNVSGVDIQNCQNMFDVAEAENSEHVRHSDSVLSHKDSMDFLASGGHSSRLYGTTNIGSQSSNVRFSVSSKYTTDCEFVFNSKNLTNCFMCFGMQNKSYYILNTQYEPDEYFTIVDQIKTEMLTRGEYADGLGLEFSAQAYNTSWAQSVFPLDEETVKNLGGFIAAIPEANVSTLDVVRPEDVPETIEEVGEEIITKVLLCAETGRPFQIQPSELAFYYKMRLPLPVIHPLVRMELRNKLGQIGKKYAAVCQSCNRAIESIADPADGYTLFCSDCFQKTVS
jgi:hypothetical protein